MRTLGDDNTNGVWNPTPVRTTIEFRGLQASFLNFTSSLGPVREL